MDFHPHDLDTLSHNRHKPESIEKEPSPEKPKFNWLTFSIFGTLMVIAWILGQFTPWFPDELAIELILFAIYSYMNSLGFKRK